MNNITSKDNSKLKAVRALVRSKKERQETSCFVMEGVRALSAFMDGTGLPCYKLKEVWISDKAPAGTAADYCIPHEFMEQLSDCQTAQGILGVVEYTPAPLEIHPEQGNYLMLDNLMDPGNLGTLIRSAVAFGFEGVLLHGDCVEVFNPKTVRATMGALPFSNVWKIDPEFFQRLEKLGYDLVSTAMTGGENLHGAAFGPKNVLVIGNEANGVSEEIQQRATRQLSIPMSGNVESLNAAVAGSICMSRMAFAGG
ncbi:MAG: RNA methyltransferase [Verrucomicrobia bacterium]|nr:RNA methyltransferase [Verrucomicrobiota bacterium]